MVVSSPCQENYPADARTGARKTVLELANPAWTRSVHLDAPGSRHGQQPVSGTADPGVVKQDNSSRGSVDTTKTHSDPQRVRMCKGEKPIGVAKGKQTNTMASSPPPAQRPYFLTPSLSPVMPRVLGSRTVLKREAVLRCAAGQRVPGRGACVRSVQALEGRNAVPLCTLGAPSGCCLFGVSAR